MGNGEKSNDSLGLFRHGVEELKADFCVKYKAWVHELHSYRRADEYVSYISRRQAMHKLEAAWQEYCDVRDQWISQPRYKIIEYQN